MNDRMCCVDSEDVGDDSVTWFSIFQWKIKYVFSLILTWQRLMDRFFLGGGEEDHCRYTLELWIIYFVLYKPFHLQTYIQYHIHPVWVKHHHTRCYNLLCKVNDSGSSFIRVVLFYCWSALLTDYTRPKPTMNYIPRSKYLFRRAKESSVVVQQLLLKTTTINPQWTQTP